MYALYDGPNFVFWLYTFFLLIIIFKIFPYCPRYSYLLNIFLSAIDSYNPIIYTKFFVIILCDDSFSDGDKEFDSILLCLISFEICIIFYILIF